MLHHSSLKIEYILDQISCYHCPDLHKKQRRVVEDVAVEDAVVLPVVVDQVAEEEEVLLAEVVDVVVQYLVEEEVHLVDSVVEEDADKVEVLRLHFIPLHLLSPLTVSTDSV